MESKKIKKVSEAGKRAMKRYYEKNKLLINKQSSAVRIMKAMNGEYRCNTCCLNLSSGRSLKKHMTTQTHRLKLEYDTIKNKLSNGE